METYIEKHFKMDFKPMANEGAVFQGACYRIAFLTSRIVRLEYSLTGCFEDRPSQTFWYREQEVPALSVKEDEFDGIGFLISRRYGNNPSGIQPVFSYQDSLSV